LAKSVRTQLVDAHQTIRDLSNELHGMRERQAPLERQVDILKSHNVDLQIAVNRAQSGPIPMLLWCPQCLERHVEGELADRPHHTHACQHCGHCWRPAVVNTAGVQFLPGFKDGEVATDKTRTWVGPDGDTISVALKGGPLGG
jgi:hypothetical protein